MISGQFDSVTQEVEDKLNDSETSQSNDAFSPRIGIVYQPMEPVLIYTSYRRSFAPNSSIRASVEVETIRQKTDL